MICGRTLHSYLPKTRIAIYRLQSLNLKLRGHYNYFGLTGNSYSLRLFRFQVHRIWKKWLLRRSNRSISWARFNDLIRSSLIRY